MRGVTDLHGVPIAVACKRLSSNEIHEPRGSLPPGMEVAKPLYGKECTMFFDKRQIIIGAALLGALEVGFVLVRTLAH
jgi:hypothetical protein